MQSKTSKNNAEVSGECMGLQNEFACETSTASELKPYRRVHPIPRITNGLSENLKNVQKHRLLMQEEIKNVLKKLMFATDSKTMPANMTGTRKEE